MYSTCSRSTVPDLAMPTDRSGPGPGLDTRIRCLCAQQMVKRLAKLANAPTKLEALHKDGRLTSVVEFVRRTLQYYTVQELQEIEESLASLNGTHYQGRGRLMHE